MTTETVMGKTHFFATAGDVIRGFGNARLFNVDECDVCGCKIEVANAISLVGVSFEDIEHLHWSVDRLDEGGWNDKVGGVVCCVCDGKNQ